MPYNSAKGPFTLFSIGAVRAAQTRSAIASSSHNRHAIIVIQFDVHNTDEFYSAYALRRRYIYVTLTKFN